MESKETYPEMKSIKISEKNYQALVKKAGQIQSKTRKQTSVNDAISFLMGEENAR